MPALIVLQKQFSSLISLYHTLLKKPQKTKNLFFYAVPDFPGRPRNSRGGCGYAIPAKTGVQGVSPCITAQIFYFRFSGKRPGFPRKIKDFVGCNSGGARRVAIAGRDRIKAQTGKVVLSSHHRPASYRPILHRHLGGEGPSGTHR